MFQVLVVLNCFSFFVQDGDLIFSEEKQSTAYLSVLQQLFGAENAKEQATSDDW